MDKKIKHYSFRIDDGLEISPIVIKGEYTQAELFSAMFLIIKLTKKLSKARGGIVSLFNLGKTNGMLDVLQGVMFTDTVRRKAWYSGIYAIEITHPQLYTLSLCMSFMRDYAEFAQIHSKQSHKFLRDMPEIDYIAPEYTLAEWREIIELWNKKISDINYSQD